MTPETVKYILHILSLPSDKLEAWKINAEKYISYLEETNRLINKIKNPSQPDILWGKKDAIKRDQWGAMS